MNIAELAPGTVWAKASYRVAYDHWKVILYRVRPDRKGSEELMSDTALTPWGTKRIARKMYKRWLKNRNVDLASRVFVFGVHLD